MVLSVVGDNWVLCGWQCLAKAAPSAVKLTGVTACVA